MDKKNAIIIILAIAIIGLSVSAYLLYVSSAEDVTEGEKKVLLLAVDPGENRPGLGAVDMAFVITLNNGTITQVAPVYPHNMAHPTAVPPASLKAQGVSRWLLHDALWEEDNEKGARLAQEIVEANTGQKTDIVVMMTPTAVDAMIQAIGPVYVPGQGYVSGNSLQVLRDEQSAGASRGPAIESLMRAMSNATQDRSKYLAMTQAAITQYNQGNIVVVPQGAFLQFLISAGIEKATS